METFALSTKIESKGGNEVITTLDRIEKKGKQTAGMLGVSSGQLTSGFRRISGAVQNVGAEIALMGTAGAGGIKQLLTAGSNLAFLFGPAGAVVASIGLTITHILSMHGKAREELKKTAEDHAKTIEQLAERADTVATLAESRRATRNVERLRAEQGRLQAQIAAAEPRFGRSGLMLDPTKAQRAELTAINAELVEAESYQRRLTEMQALQASFAGELAKRLQDLETRSKKRKEYEEAIAKLIQEQRDAVLDMLTKATPPEVLAHWSNELKKGIKPIEVPVIPKIEADALMPKAIQDRALALALEIGQAVESGISDVLGSLFSDDVGGGLLRSLGAFITRVGEALLKFGEIIRMVAAAIYKSLLGLGPGAAIAGGLALIALGSAISGMGGDGGRGSGGYAGGYGGGGGFGRQPMESTFTLGSPATSTSSGMGSQAAQLTPAQPIIHNWTVIGPNDPRAQSAIVKLVNNASLRGIKVRDFYG